MRIVLYILIALVLLAVAAAIYVRVAPLDVEALHVDPSTATPPSSPNYALMAGTGGSYIDADPVEVASRLHAAAEADDATVLAGSHLEGHVTYVVRSRLMGFPDVISVRFSPEGEGTQVDIFSRSIYGYSDMGVNTARAQRWMQAARGATVFNDGD
ncbi:DUF1499 domain-containing protein [Hasllibacter sp. MH4015]|uniref:DUF1499 domain-containing protein n=1 Tax=Hasllibacter sp. MH4015 TaxID=2854029 RepID=UPI001CD281D5|nr:DUF1499 domain-containing protein [Hasllibacter sp. MH4015]